MSNEPASFSSGFLQPTDDRARRAFKAIDEQRFDDAAKHINAILEDSTDSRAWKSYMSGRLAWAQHDLTAAEVSLTKCIDVLNQCKINQDCNDSIKKDVTRLIAAAHELLGSVLRRQDRPEDSLQHHEKAYQLREDCGTPEELFETATSLGVTQRILRRYSDATSWFERSKQHAESCSTGNRTFMAIALSNLATVYVDTQPQDALKAASAARTIWHEIDPTTPEALLADVALGNILLTLGQKHIESADQRAGETLAEAILKLSESRVALLACGREHLETAAVVAERLDFAKRLASSLIAEP